MKIAKATKHLNVTYTQEKVAEEVLRNDV